MRRSLIWRRCAQIAVILLFCLLPWLNAEGFPQLTGTLFSFDFFGIPFADPAGALQAAVNAALLGAPLAATVCLGALGALLVAFFFGRVFCGWLCPYGFFSECVWHLRGRQGKNAVNRAHALKIFLVKAGILLLSLAAVALFGFPLLSLLSFPGELSLLPVLVWQHDSIYLLAAAFFLPLLLLCLEFISGRRLWCTYACPQSVLLGLAASARPDRLAGLEIGWQSGACTCGARSPCREACPAQLNPRTKNGPSRRDCLMCGDCVKACSRYGKALRWKT